jgi:hypothetical protein
MPTRAQTTDLHRAKRGVAVLTACVVQTLNESDPSFQRRFVKRLEQAYHVIRDNETGEWEGDTIQELELLTWTRELLSGFSLSSGQGKPFLDGYKP